MDFDIYEFSEDFREYGGYLKDMTMEHDVHPLYQGGFPSGSMNSYVGRRGRIKVDLEFTYTEGLNSFARDMKFLGDLKEEERLREQNPVLQRAYEEYKILLKLYK